MSGKDRHLHQIDLVRVLVFAAVIGVHTIANVNADSSEASGAMLMALHFTREAFFALSGFVLVYAQRNSTRPPGRAFLSRRIRLVLLPYLTWTVIYWADAIAITPPKSLGSAIKTLGIDAGEGTASYHLYFLLVTLQVYVVFRGLWWLLRRTQGHHVALIVTTAVYQGLLLGWLHYIWTPGGFGGGLIGHAGTLLPSYLLWVIGGGVLAMHREAFDDWVRSHGRLIAAAFVLGLAAAEAAYYIDLARVPRLLQPADVLHADDVLQPVMLLWSAAAIIGVYAVALRWNAREKRPAGAFVATASMASFGVFLVHPLFVQLVVTHGLGPDDSVMPSDLATLVTYGLVVMAAVVAVAVFLRTPFSTMLTGRPQLAKKRKPGTVIDGDPTDEDPTASTPERTPALVGARRHRKLRVITVGRVAAVLAVCLFVGSVSAISRVNDREHHNLFLANEFAPVNSLVTPSNAKKKATTPALPNPPAIQKTISLTVDGMQRSYLLVTPAGATVGLPVLIFLHGVTTTPGEELDRDGFEPLAQNRQAVLVYPGGYRGSWNAGDDCCGAALLDNVNDVDFLKAVAADVTKGEHTDAKRVYLGGFSNGAKLVWKIACDAPVQFAAFAEFGGNPGACANRGVAPFFVGVGGKDGTEPIVGKPADTRGPHPAIKPELTTILAKNGCAGSSKTSKVDTAVITAYASCAKAPVTYVDWLTEDHHWPRPPIVTAQGSAATLIWEFFSAQKKTS